MSSGWVKVYRKLSESKLWTSEPFTRGQAWVDLILLANHSDNFYYLRDHKIRVSRGQVGWSVVRLGLRWKWSRSKTQKFLNDLEKEQQIVQRKSQSTSIITLINYEIYQQKEQQDVQQKDNRKTTEKQQKDTNKNDKNNKNEENDNLFSRKENFKNEIWKFEGEFDEDHLNQFFNYWSEETRDGESMRYESEEYWNLKTRIERFKPIES